MGGRPSSESFPRQQGQPTNQRATLRKDRVHATSAAMATVIRTDLREKPAAEQELTVTPTPIRPGYAGSRNTSLRPVVKADAIAVIHDHCAVYTGPEAVEVILDLVGWKPADIGPRSRLLEPACGDGSFLLPAVERLLDWARSHIGREVDLAPMIRAYEFEPDTVKALRGSIEGLLRRRGEAADEASRLASTWIRCEDFLLAKSEGGYTHVVGNPPYMRWSLVPNAPRSAYENELPKIAARGDLCLAFLWKAAEFADNAGSRIAFLCADRWLRCAYGRGVRGALARSHTLSVHIEVHGLPVFKGPRKVGAYAAVTMLERGRRDVKACVGRATSIEHLLSLAKSAGQRGRSSGKVWPTRNEGGARLASKDARELMDILDGRGHPLPDIGVTIRCGLALGLAKAFVVDSETLIEGEYLLPYLRSRDLDENGETSSPMKVANVWTSEGALIDLDHAPLLKAHLELFKADLTNRACVADAKDWYRTIDKFVTQRIDAPKILLKGMSRRARIALDPGGSVPSNALYSLTSSKWPLELLASVLRAGVLDLFGEVLSPRFSGGTKRFDGNVLRQVQLPSWDAVSSSVKDRIETRAVSAGFDAALVSDLFKLRSKTLRTTVDRMLHGIDQGPASSGSAL